MKFLFNIYEKKFPWVGGVNCDRKVCSHAQKPGHDVVEKLIVEMCQQHKLSTGCIRLLQENL